MQTIKKLFDHLHWANQRILQNFAAWRGGEPGSGTAFCPYIERGKYMVKQNTRKGQHAAASLARRGFGCL